MSNSRFGELFEDRTELETTVIRETLSDLKILGDMKRKMFLVDGVMDKVLENLPGKKKSVVQETRHELQLPPALQSLMQSNRDKLISATENKVEVVEDYLFNEEDIQMIKLTEGMNCEAEVYEYILTKLEEEKLGLIMSSNTVVGRLKERFM